MDDRIANLQSVLVIKLEWQVAVPLHKSELYHSSISLVDLCVPWLNQEYISCHPIHKQEELHYSVYIQTNSFDLHKMQDLVLVPS